jgi:hypothetical protein
MINFVYYFNHDNIYQNFQINENIVYFGKKGSKSLYIKLSKIV